MHSFHEMPWAMIRVSMRNVLIWLHDKILGATDYGIAHFTNALKFKIPHGAQDADHILHLLDNYLTPMDYVVELLCIKLHMREIRLLFLW